ncbi:response regulator [bacterium]|nr:response regulator [bacterium]
MKNKDESKPLILIVDDNPINLDVLVETLQADYRLSVSKNGKKALEYAKEYKPQLILLDIMMPEMDGFKVCEILKSSPDTKNISIIFITALHETVNVTKGFDIGAVDYITKPFNPIEVRARVKTHISLVHYQTNLEEKVHLRTAQLESANIKLTLMQKEIIQRLGKAAEYKDNETGQHVIRVSIYSGLVAETLGLSPDTVELIRTCSPMHDVGKIGIPDGVLLKQGRLNKKEWEIMKTHSLIGAEILRPMPEDNENQSKVHDKIFQVIHQIGDSKLLETSMNIAAYHHERWDGTGYPNGLSKDEIPIEARIVSVVDVYDALSSNRPYKNEFSEEKCQKILREMAGVNLEPRIVDAFFDSIGEIVKIKSELRD